MTKNRDEEAQRKHERYNSCKRDNRNKLKQKGQENAREKRGKNTKETGKRSKHSFFRHSSLRLSQTNTEQYE